MAAEDGPSFEVLGRSLFIHIAAAFTEEFEALVARRNELAQFAPTSGPDVEFESCRAALSLGDLGGAQRRLRHLEETLSHLEDDWSTVQVLVAQAELLAETIRGLGGDPAPALGPLAEGRRLAKLGDRAAAEPVLARAGLALWSILEPAFLADLARLKDRLIAQRETGADVGPALAELREIAPDLRRRSFVSVVGLVPAAPRARRGAGRAPPARRWPEALVLPVRSAADAVRRPPGVPRLSPTRTPGPGASCSGGSGPRPVGPGSRSSRRRRSSRSSCSR